MVHAPGQPDRRRDANPGLDMDPAPSVEAYPGFNQETVMGACRRHAGQDKLVPVHLGTVPATGVALEIGTAGRSPDRLWTLTDGPTLRLPNGHRGHGPGHGHIHPLVGFIPDLKRQPLQALGPPDVHTQVFIPY